MSNVFGSCVDLHATWEEGVDELGRATVTFSSNVEDQEPVTICIDPLKGAMIDGESVEVVDGVLQLPTDLFGAGELSTDGETYTITFPGQDPQTLCVNPVKDVLDAEGNSLVTNGVATLPAGSTTVPEPEGFHTITTDDGVATEVCLDPLKDVLDAEGNSLVTDAVATLPAGSTTVPEPEGFHTITTDDGVATIVCLSPVKTINDVEPDINGNINVADLLSTTTDNGDGTYTTINADGTPVTWSGDTFASGTDNGDGTATITFSDGSALTFCLNPVKSVVQNEDGLGATVALADGTAGQLAYPTSTSVSEAGITTTTHPDGTAHTSCDNPVKEALNENGESVVDEDGVAQLPPRTVLQDCDGAQLQNEAQVVRKIVDFSGTPWPTDGNGNQIAPCPVKSIGLVKSALPGPYVEGDIVTYTFSVTNNGTEDLTNVSIMDNLIVVSGGPIDLAAGATDSTTFTGTYVYTAEDVEAGGVVNTAVASGVAPDGTVVTDMDTAEVFNLAPPESPAIMLTKTVTSGPGPYSEGDAVQYAFVVANIGDVALSGVVVNDPLLTVAGGPISLGVGATDSTTFTGSYPVTAADVTAGTVDNTATAQGTSPGGVVVTDDDAASVQTEACTPVDVTVTGAELFASVGNPIDIGGGCTMEYVPSEAVAPNGVISPGFPAAHVDAGSTDIHYQTLSDNFGNAIPVTQTILFSCPMDEVTISFDSLNGFPRRVGTTAAENGVANDGDTNNYEQIHFVQTPSATNNGATGTYDPNSTLAGHGGGFIQSEQGNSTADATFQNVTQIDFTYVSLQRWYGDNPLPGELPEEERADNLFFTGMTVTKDC